MQYDYKQTDLQVMTSIDRKAQDFVDYYYLQSVDAVKYILKDIFICSIKEQCSDQGESKWKCQKTCQNNVKDRLRQIKWLHNVDLPVAKWVSMEHREL